MMVSEIQFLATMPQNVRGRWFSTLKHIDIVNRHVDIANHYVDIVNRYVDIVNRRVDVVTWQSAHGATNRATVE